MRSGHLRNVFMHMIKKQMKHEEIAVAKVSDVHQDLSFTTQLQSNQHEEREL